MNTNRSVKIIGTGKYLPENIITSEYLEQALKLPGGWSDKYSGVRERRWTNKEESNASMAIEALEMALRKAKLKIEDIDLLISASATFDFILPFQAAYILKLYSEKRKLNIPAMDINASCLSFINAFDVASTLLSEKKYRRIAIVSSEISSKGLSDQNKEIYTLFGDGAGAVILELDPMGKSKSIKSLMRVYPEGFYHSMIKGGGNMYPFKDHTYIADLHSFTMQGKHLLKLAKKTIPPFFDEFFEDLDTKIDEVDVIVSHQASKAGLSIFTSCYPNIKGLVYSNLDTHGNCIAASIPMCLHDVIEKGYLKRGQSCLLAGTAAGFAIGSILINY